MQLNSFKTVLMFAKLNDISVNRIIKHFKYPVPSPPSQKMAHKFEEKLSI